MSKVFRLYKNGDNTFTDWHESASFPYNSENRDGKNGIDDPEGASSKSEITSIPSPFADRPGENCLCACLSTRQGNQKNQS